MAKLKPFKAYRPRTKLVKRVAALEEAREIGRDNPHSFLHVDKAEIDLDPAINTHSKVVYEKARDNLQAMIEDDILIQDKEEKYYIYKQIIPMFYQI